MTNENKTVEQLCDYLANNGKSVGEPIRVAMPSLADLIFAAHKRELAAKDRIIEAKDVEIARHKRKKYILKGCIFLEQEEVGKRDVLIKELTDEMERIMSIFCHGNCEGCKLKNDCDVFRCRALVKKAREVVK